MVSADQSAVSYLLYLEKGFSAKGGEKILTIMEFPKIVEKNSFPNFLKSCFQKLSVCFLEGNNTERMYIIEAIEKIQSNITLISGFGSIVDNFHQVIYKNDPLSRIAALCAFNALAPCLQLKNIDDKIVDVRDRALWNDTSSRTAVSGKISNSSVISTTKPTINNLSADEDVVAYSKIMNTIIDCLSSTNKDELHAAIRVASTFSRINPQFSKILVPKVNEILLTANNSAIVDKLINLYSAMSYHLEGAHLAYECCYRLFCSHPFRALNVMATICFNCSSLVHRYMEFLLDMLSSDEMVQDISLRTHASLQLSKVAKYYPSVFHGPSFLNHIWDLLFVGEKIKKILSQPNGGLMIGYGLVMWIHLVKNDAATSINIFTERVDDLMQLLSSLTTIAQNNPIYFLLDYLRLTIFLKDGCCFDGQCLKAFKNLLECCVFFSQKSLFRAHLYLGIELCDYLYLKIDPKLQNIIHDFVFNLCFSLKYPLKDMVKILRKIFQNNQLLPETLNRIFKEVTTMDSHCDRFTVYKLLFLQANNKYNQNRSRVSLDRIEGLCFSINHTLKNRLSTPTICMDVYDRNIGDDSNVFEITSNMLIQETNLKMLTLLGLDCLFRGDVYNSLIILHSLTSRKDVSTSILQCLTYFCRLARCESMVMLVNDNVKKHLQMKHLNSNSVDILSQVSQDLSNLIVSNVSFGGMYKNQREFQELFLLVRIDILNLTGHWLKHRQIFLSSSPTILGENSLIKQLLFRVKNITCKWAQLQYLSIDADNDSEQFLLVVGSVLDILHNLLVDFSNYGNKGRGNNVNSILKGVFEKFLPESKNSSKYPYFIQNFVSTMPTLSRSTNAINIIEYIVQEVLLVGWPIPKYFFHVDNHTWGLLCVSHGSSLSSDSTIVVKKNVYLVFLVEGIIKYTKDASNPKNIERVSVTFKATPMPKNNSTSVQQHQLQNLLIYSVNAPVNKNYFHTEVQILFQSNGLFSVHAEIDSAIDSSGRSWHIPYSCPKLTVQT